GACRPVRAAPLSPAHLGGAGRGAPLAGPLPDPLEGDPPPASAPPNELLGGARVGGPRLEMNVAFHDHAVDLPAHRAPRIRGRRQPTDARPFLDRAVGVERRARVESAVGDAGVVVTSPEADTAGRKPGDQGSEHDPASGGAHDRSHSHERRPPSRAPPSDRAWGLGGGTPWAPTPVLM